MTTTRPGAAIASLAWVALAAGSATANMASPFQAGVLAGEPFGQTASMTILGERLTLDLRPLAGRDNAQVHAEYRIDNPGAPLDATLDFVATQITEAPTVLVDGRPVSATPQPDAPLPESWYPPETTWSAGQICSFPSTTRTAGGIACDTTPVVLSAARNLPSTGTEHLTTRSCCREPTSRRATVRMTT